MATPKKKVSRSRRNMRRFAGGNRLEAPTVVLSPIDGGLTRPHRVSLRLVKQEKHLQVTAKYGKTNPNQKTFGGKSVVETTGEVLEPILPQKIGSPASEESSS